MAWRYRVEAWKGRDGWRWRIRARNGRILATSEAYSSRTAARRSAQPLATALRAAIREV